MKTTPRFILFLAYSIALIGISPGAAANQVTVFFNYTNSLGESISGNVLGEDHGGGIIDLWADAGSTSDYWEAHSLAFGHFTGASFDGTSGIVSYSGNQITGFSFSGSYWGSIWTWSIGASLNDAYVSRGTQSTAMPPVAYLAISDASSVSITAGNRSYTYFANTNVSDAGSTIAMIGAAFLSLATLRRRFAT